MTTAPRNIRFSLTALVMGGLSIPLAFARHLVSLALVLSVLSLVLWAVGKWQVSRSDAPPSESSVRRATIGSRLAAVGLLCSVVIWVLYANRILPF